MCVLVACPSQETRWNKTHKRSGQAVDTKCHQCAQTLSKGYPGLAWNSAVSLAASKPNWAREFKEARERLHGEGGPCLSSLENVGCHNVSGYKVMKLYNFVTEAEFFKTYSCKPQDLNVNVEKIIDEHGKEIVGVILADPTPRKIEVYSYTDLDLTESMLKDVNQIREHQGRELRDLIAADISKLRPKCMRPACLGQQPAPTHEKLAELAKQREEEKKVQEEQRRLEAEAGPKEPEVVAPAEADVSSSSEFEELDEGAMVLPSQRAKREKAKAKAQAKKHKGASKSVGKAGPALPRVSVCLPKPSSIATPMLAPSQTASAPGLAGGGGGADGLSVRSGVSSASRRATATSDCDVNSRIAELSVTKLLEGDAMGDKFYNMKRKIDEIEAKDPGSADLVLLRAHQAVAFVARDRCTVA